MADVAELESILKEVEAIDGVHDAVLVSRSGMYIAGTVPEGVFQDTFVAMFAILLGAAETATSELKDRIDTVVLNLESSRIVVVNDRPKAIFGLRPPPGVFRGPERREPVVPGRPAAVHGRDPAPELVEEVGVAPAGAPRA